MNNIDSYTQPVAVSELDAQTRGKFVSRTYAHLFGAICAFILIEASIVLDHQGSADVDLASNNNFRVGCPTCFVTLPTDVNMNL